MSRQLYLQLSEIGVCLSLVVCGHSAGLALKLYQVGKVVIVPLITGNW